MSAVGPIAVARLLQRHIAQALLFAPAGPRAFGDAVIPKKVFRPAVALERPMSNVTLFGFPRSTFVKVAGLILTARDVEYRFHDTEDEMYLPVHLERHPFGRVPALQHDDFMLYETNAIAAYIDDVFPGPKLTPADPRKRARVK